MVNLHLNDKNQAEKLLTVRNSRKHACSFRVACLSSIPPSLPQLTIYSGMFTPVKKLVFILECGLHERKSPCSLDHLSRRLAALAHALSSLLFLRRFVHNSRICSLAAPIRLNRSR